MEWITQSWEWITLFSEPISFVFGFFVGGGIVSTILQERWGDRRSRREMLLERTGALLRTYQIYMRFVRRPLDRRDDAEWDNIHANYYAEARLIGFEPRLTNESKRLIVLANKLANLHKDKHLKTENRGSKEGEVGKEFREILERILAMVNK